MHLSQTRTTSRSQVSKNLSVRDIGTKNKEYYSGIENLTSPTILQLLMCGVWIYDQTDVHLFLKRFFSR